MAEFIVTLLTDEYLLFKKINGLKNTRLFYFILGGYSSMVLFKAYVVVN